MQAFIRNIPDEMIREDGSYNRAIEGEDRKYLYWFASIRELSQIKKRKLALTLREFREIYEIETFKKHPFHGLTDLEIAHIQEAKNTWDLEGEYAKLQEKHIKMVVYGEVDYPKRLRPYKDAPFSLFYKGKLPDETRKTVAIVGARRCSRYGEKYAIEYSQMLANCGVQVISGLAKGVDGIAQRAALDAGGDSYGILGNGVDICYPREHIGLYNDLCVSGGVISEFPIKTPPLAMNFPLRNRIISGLSDVVIVMEAKERSGSLITADLALEQGKDVYALPGMIDSELSRGCNELINQGAGMLNSMHIFMEELGLSEQNTSRNTVENKKILETKERMVYSCIRVDAKPVDWILNQCHLPIHEVVNALVSLELKGYIKEISRNYYVKL